MMVQNELSLIKCIMYWLYYFSAHYWHFSLEFDSYITWPSKSFFDNPILIYSIITNELATFTISNPFNTILNLWEDFKMSHLIQVMSLWCGRLILWDSFLFLVYYWKMFASKLVLANTHIIIIVHCLFYSRWIRIELI